MNVVHYGTLCSVPSYSPIIALRVCRLFSYSTSFIVPRNLECPKRVSAAYRCPTSVCTTYRVSGVSSVRAGPGLSCPRLRGSVGLATLSNRYARG
jgi:hypothetical protein